MALYGLKRPIKLPGGRMGMLTLVNTADLSGGRITGFITTFTKIDTSGKWFDEELLDDASPDTVKQVRILPKVHPNSAIFRYEFDLQKHLFTFENYSRGKQLLPKSCLVLLKTLAETPSIVSRFGEAAISIIQDKASLDRIFKLDQLKSVTFTILRPNPDIWDEGLEADLDNHFAATGAQQMVVTYKAPPGGSLQDIAELRRVAGATLRNGQIEATGKNAQGHQKISTSDYPLIEQTTFDPEGDGEAEAFSRLVRAMRRRAG